MSKWNLKGQPPAGSAVRNKGFGAFRERSGRVEIALDM